MKLLHPAARLRLAITLAGAVAFNAFAAAQSGQEVIRGNDEFEFVYRAKLPRTNELGQLWLPLAKTSAWQTVTVDRISSPVEGRTVRDRDHGNDILVLPVGPGDAGKTIEITYRVTRSEKAPYASHEAEAARYLKPERLVPATETFKTLAAALTRGKQTGIERGRALYDHVASRMKYDKSGAGWGRGDAVYACDARAGNCTDFHAYFIALARAAGIPARFAIGVTIPADKDEGAIAGYHCWAEFFADGVWVPVDISEAAKNPALAQYYFGHHPANRFELSVGRDLVVEPAPASGPINFLIYPLFEAGGKVVKTETEFAFRRVRK
ncbi:MAG: transglutaminase domain-containing protein [Verrucomicrobiota bacterium]|nr:transglutaminase domain-containing protein [Verrucomicrobiota bacterium]